MTGTVGGALIATIIAFLTGLLALMSQEGVNQLSDISQVSLMVLSVGAALTFFKDFNTLWTRRMLNGENSPKTSSPVPVGIIALLLACSLMSACAGTRAAYKAADGLEETAFVFSNHFRLLVAEGNSLAEQGFLRGSALSSMQDIVRTARPLLAETSRTARAYKAFQSAETEQELTEAIAAAAVQVSNLYNAIQAAGGSTSLLERIDREREMLLVANLNWSTP